MPKGIFKHNPHTKETRKKMSLSAKMAGVGKWMKGRKPSLETRKKISLSSKGKPKYCLRGIKRTEEFKNNLRKINSKENHPQWKGGISFESYTINWTETLKKSIRERDHYTCYVCGKEPSIDVHHIDYDKKNCNPENLIVLCRACHAKTNHNRNYWLDYFNK